MEYRINNKKVRIFSQYLEKINSGKEGIVYKYRGKCLKLYHDKPRKTVLSFRDSEYMTKLRTERVLLPETTVCDKKHVIKGYVINPYVESKKNIYDISGEFFLNEVKKIKDELIYLGENYITVDDFWLDNFICSDKFYFLDPGSYIVHWNMIGLDDDKSFIFLANYNLEQFNMFLVVYIILKYIKKQVHDCDIYNDIFNEIHQRYLLSSCDNKMDYISQFIVPEIPLKESIKKLIKCHKI